MAVNKEELISSSLKIKYKAIKKRVVNKVFKLSHQPPKFAPF
jgi:hypothetical protein